MLVFKPRKTVERLGTGGSATIDPHSHKVQTKLYQIPKFGVNGPNIVVKIQPFKNAKIYKGIYSHPDDKASGRVRMAIHFFVNFEVFKSLYLSQNYGLRTGSQRRRKKIKLA